MSTEGIVYCLENPKMPGLVRIGILQRSIDTVNIIDNEFTPLPSELIYAIAVTNPVDVELKLHELFKTDRVRPEREYFSASSDQVKTAMQLVDGREVNLGEFQSVQQSFVDIDKSLGLMSEQSETIVKESIETTIPKLQLARGEVLIYLENGLDGDKTDSSDPTGDWYERWLQGLPVRDYSIEELIEHRKTMRLITCEVLSSETLEVLFLGEQYYLPKLTVKFLIEKMEQDEKSRFLIDALTHWTTAESFFSDYYPETLHALLVRTSEGLTYEEYQTKYQKNGLIEVGWEKPIKWTKPSVD